MARSGPRKVARYSEQFKATAVKLSRLPEVVIQDVAVALDIHPLMLSRWRKQAREGMIVTRGVKLDVDTSAELKRLRQPRAAVQGAQGGGRAAKKSDPVCFRTKAEIFAFIEANRGAHRVALMCRVYGVTRAGFYAWCERGRSRRADDNEALLPRIEAILSGVRGVSPALPIGVVQYLGPGVF